MKDNFPIVLPWTLAHEGGWSNHPKDPGGATMRGVTQRVYTAYLNRKGVPSRSVRSITPEEIMEIYKFQYWDALRCDELPSGLDYAVFDFGVNSGVSRAAKFLQRIVGARQDGIVGEDTLSKVSNSDATFVIEKLCADRMAFLRRLKTWKTFGKGWTRRVVGEFAGTQNDDTGVIDRAMLLANGTIKTPKEAVKYEPKAPAPGKGVEEERENVGESHIVRANVLQILGGVGLGAQSFYMGLGETERLILLGVAGVVVVIAAYTIRERFKAWVDGWR
jgi:lysozyme family protein